VRQVGVGRPEDNLSALLEVIAVKRTPSPSSGNPLEELVVTSQLSSHDALLLQRELEAGEVRVYEDRDENKEPPYSRYHVATYFTSETETGAGRTFQIDLVEIEDLHPTGLSIADLELPAPYRYSESWRSTGLEIVARAEVSNAQLDELFELSITDPHLVVRRGVSEEPRLMSLLLTAWSPGSEGNAACEFWLNDPKDVDNDWALVARSVCMGRDALAGVEALLAALEERGVLPAADVDAIRDDADRRRRELHFRMFEVGDLEADVEWRRS
jgi:hypothetical protein